MSGLVQPHFLRGLHLLRGICAAGVATYHYLAWYHDIAISSMGTFGVYTFFTLSAVVLLHNHAAEFEETITRESLVRFYLKRIVRILPLLAVVAVIQMIVVYFQQGASFDHTWKRTFLTGSGLFALHMPGLLSTTTGAWSLGIEIAFYLLFPMLALLAAGASRKTLWLTILVLLLAQYALLSGLPASDHPDHWGQYTMPLTFAPFFALGFLIHRSTRPSSSKDLWLSLVCIACVFGFSMISDRDVFQPGPRYLLLTGLSAMAVYFAFSAEVPNPAYRAFGWLGKISYSLYLTHWMAKQAADAIAQPLTFFLFAPAFAVAFWYLVENKVSSKLNALFDIKESERPAARDQPNS